MSENTNLDSLFKAILDDDLESAKRLVEEHNASQRANTSDSEEDFVYNDAGAKPPVGRFSYADENLDNDKASRLRRKLGKIPLSTIYSVFILDCLNTIKRGRKKSTILELLNAGGLPIAKNTLTTKMNRLKSKGYITWTNGLQPGEPEIALCAQGNEYLSSQLSSGLRGLELSTYNDAKARVVQMLADNS